MGQRGRVQTGEEKPLKVFGESPDPCVHVVDLLVILIDDVVF